MIHASRPLRFLGVVVGGWVGVRATMLWPVAEFVPPLVRAVTPSAAMAQTPGRPAPTLRPAAWPVLARSPAPPGRAGHRAVATETAPALDSPPVATPLQGWTPPRPTPPVFTVPSDPTPPGVDPPPVFRGSRWSGSAWAILRPDGRATPFASQLGGSQAGARIAYALGDARRVALYARASTAIDAAQREAAVGLDWRPTRLPVHLIAERRIGIEGVRSGTAIGAVGGVGPSRIAGPVRVEGYAQGGVIFRDGREGFADGSIRFTLPVAERIDLGLGAWGGAQKGAERVDVGPTVGVAVPVAGRNLRLSADWRQRVAGDARPGSGPAMSLGVDF